MEYTNKIIQTETTITLDLTQGIGTRKEGCLDDELFENDMIITFMECEGACELMMRDNNCDWYAIEHKYHYAMNLNDLLGLKVEFYKVDDRELLEKLNNTF